MWPDGQSCAGEGGLLLGKQFCDSRPPGHPESVTWLAGCLPLQPGAAFLGLMSAETFSRWWAGQGMDGAGLFPISLVGLKSVALTPDQWYVEGSMVACCLGIDKHTSHKTLWSLWGKCLGEDLNTS